MTLAGHTLHSGTHARSIATGAVSRAPLHVFAGFFIAYRFCFTYLGFRSDPRAGTIASLGCTGLLLAVALLHTLGDEHFSMRLLTANRTLRWVVAYLAVSGVSLFWTAASSTTDATGQWSGMAMVVAIVLLLIRHPNMPQKVDAVMKGFVLGVLFFSLVAWLFARTDDFRLGDYDFLHPNIIGMDCAIAFFIAQYLGLKKPAWRWCCVALGITMLRSISKTSIIAFVIAETFYLSREKQISRWVKIQSAAAALIIVAAFSTVLEEYFSTYVTSGNVSQAETLTGRTAVWLTAVPMALERPWIGHGFYSFRALIPAFGSFEPWHAHNELLQQFFEYGLLGVFVTIALYLSLFFASKRSRAGDYRRLVQVVMLFAVIHGLTESLNFDLTVPLWLIVALVIVLAQPTEVSAS